MKESCVRHWAQFNEFHSFEIKHHGVFCSGTVVVATEDDDFIWGDQGCCFSFYGQWELDRQNAPLVICNIILLNGIDPSAALIATKHKNIWIFKDNSRACASFLVKICYSLPAVHVDGISFAALKNAIDGSSADSIDEISLVRQGVCISVLIERGLFCAVFTLGIVHENRSWDISEARIQTTRDQNISICESDGHRIRLESQIVRHLLSRPEVPCKVITQDEILIVRITKEIAFGDRFVLMVKEFEGVLVWKLDDWVFERSDLLEHLIGNLRIQTDCAMFELVKRRIKSLVDIKELFLHSFKFALVLDFSIL